MAEEAKNQKLEETKKSESSDDGFKPAQIGIAEDVTTEPARKFSVRQSGFAAKDEYSTKLLDLARVTRVTGGGKRLRFRAVVVAGDKKSKIGIGIDKGRDVSQAVEKATNRAKKNMMNIAIVNGTIPHQVEAKFGPAKILMKQQKTGRGLVAGGVARTICDLAGIKDVSAKMLSGSKNKLNNARVTIEALKKLKIRS